MVAHVTVPALDSVPNHVATISPVIDSDLLEKQLGFKGIIVTDALDMAGPRHLFSNKIGRAATEAFKAGEEPSAFPGGLPAPSKPLLKATRVGADAPEKPRNLPPSRTRR